MENRKFIENKGEFNDSSQIKRMKNCAIRDGMAQSKLEWRKFGDSFEMKNSFHEMRGRETLKEKLKPYLQTGEWSE